MNILENIKASLSPSQIGSLAGALGETPGATEMAMSGALPALLGGFAKEGATQQGAAGLIDMMKQLPFAGALGDLLGGKDDPLEKSGESMVSHMFGGHLSSIANGIGRFAGMKGTSVQYLLAMAAPMVLGGVAKAAPPGGFTPQALMGELDHQKPYIAKALPAGLSGLAGLIGVPGLARAAQGASAAGAKTVGESRRWLPLLIGAIALGALLLFGARTCSTRRAMTNLPAVTVTTLSLPGGRAIEVPHGSIGEQLYQYMSGNEPTPRTFTFDYLNFNTADPVYTASSQPTLDAITAILKAYPSAMVRVEGFTDSEGDDAMNQNLSEGRAQTVAKALIAGGVEPARVTAVGFGETRPIADNETEAGRAKNRRVMLVVTRK
jgi:outer membrane protein OmpA-like peptidoglycan-associated protein